MIGFFGGLSRKHTTQSTSIDDSRTKYCRVDDVNSSTPTKEIPMFVFGLFVPESRVGPKENLPLTQVAFDAVMKTARSITPYVVSRRSTGFDKDLGWPSPASRSQIRDSLVKVMSDGKGKTFGGAFAPILILLCGHGEERGNGGFCSFNSCVHVNLVTECMDQVGISPEQPVIILGNMCYGEKFCLYHGQRSPIRVEKLAGEHSNWRCILSSRASEKSFDGVFLETLLQLIKEENFLSSLFYSPLQEVLEKMQSKQKILFPANEEQCVAFTLHRCCDARQQRSKSKVPDQ
jgi:hypothetical protein